MPKRNKVRNQKRVDDTKTSTLVDPIKWTVEKIASFPADGPIPPDVLEKLDAISADRDRRGKQPKLTEDQTKGMIEAFVKHVYGEHYEIVDEDEDE